MIAGLVQNAMGLVKTTMTILPRALCATASVLYNHLFHILRRMTQRSFCLQWSHSKSSWVIIPRQLLVFSGDGHWQVGISWFMSLSIEEMAPVRS